MAEASGVRQHTCPWQALLDPFVQAVIRAHTWREKGCLDREVTPAAVVWGVEIFAGALNEVIAHDRRLADEERKRRDAARDGQTWGPSGARRPAMDRRRR